MPHPSGAWVHDLDPFLWRIHGEFGIRWYGLAYLVGLALGGWCLAQLARRNRAPFASGEVQDFAFVVGLAMVLGGRLGYGLFYEPSLFWTFGGGLPWWGILRVTDGGMASHGGIIGLAVGAWWWSRRHHRDLGALFDGIATLAGIGIICGRLANFVNGELWGKPCASSLPWAVVFPTEFQAPANLDPDAAMTWRLERATLLHPRHPSQIYAALLEGLLPLVVAVPVYLRQRRPLLVSGLVLALYAVGRFIDEFWREPDQGQPGSLGHALLLGYFTKGQFLTLPVFAIGIALMIWAWRRGPRPQAYLPPAIAS